MKFSQIAEEEQTMHVNISSIITPDMKKIEKAFKRDGYEIRLVGGSIRDLILHQVPKDFDLATDATPDQMIELFKKNSFRYIPTGIDHGTLTVLGPKTREPYEITTLRIDSAHTGRHAETEWTTSWEEDALRRDLTYNALSADFDGTVYDYHNGIEDLQNGKTRFVGDPNQRIKEDYLRILRMFRFAGRYGHVLTPKEKMAVSRNVKGLEVVSGERIWVEVYKILSGNNTVQVLNDMKQTGAAKMIGLPVNDLTKLDMIKKVTSNPVTIIMSLVTKPEQLEHFITKWKWSNPEKKLGQFLLDYKFEDFNLEIAEDMVIDGRDKNHVIELAHLRINPQIASAMEKWKPPVFPVQGKDLVDMGMKPGPKMGKALNYTKALWKSARFKPSKQELLTVLKSHLDAPDAL